MIYFLITFTILMLVIIFLFKKGDQKMLSEIRKNWGIRINKYRNFNIIERYAEQNESPRFTRLTPQTLKDIDIQNLFSFLDRTGTGIGQQFLYNKIICPTNNLNKLKELSTHSDFFQKEVAKRELVQKILYRLEKNGTSRIVKLFSLEDSGIVKHLKLFKLLTAIVIMD